jgi:hypothetical protein
VDGTDLRVSAKSGIALFPNDGSDADTLLTNAETALEKATASGEQYLFYTAQMNVRVAGKLFLENKLRKALEEEQFVLYYQPKVDLMTGRISGLEGLIRWNDPETGMVPPLEFIPLLEETGLTADEWTLVRETTQRHWKWLEGLGWPRLQRADKRKLNRRNAKQDELTDLIALHVAQPLERGELYRRAKEIRKGLIGRPLNDNEARELREELQTRIRRPKGAAPTSCDKKPDA